MREREVSLPEVRDPNDRIFLVAAIIGNAAYLITGDADLLAMRSDFSVPIVTAAELETSLGRGE